MRNKPALFTMNQPLLLSMLVLCITLQSCISINANGYERLSDVQRQKVVRPSCPLESLQRNDTIYVVNDSDVRRFLLDKELAIVCHYLGWCTGPYCIPLEIELGLLRETGLPFLMIAGDFNSAANYHADYPFITIDAQYYKTSNYSRAIKRLMQPLGCGKKWWYSYSLFRRGELIGSARTPEELTQMCEEAKQIKNKKHENNLFPRLRLQPRQRHGGAFA